MGILFTQQPNKTIATRGQAAAGLNREVVVVNMVVVWWLHESSECTDHGSEALK